MFGLTFERSRDVLARQQTGDADVATEEPVLHRKQPHPTRQVREQRLEHRRAHLPGHDHVPAVRGGTCVDRRGAYARTGVPRGAVAVGGRAVDPGEEARARTRPDNVVARERGAHFGFEGAGHPDAVFVLLNTVVQRERGERALREEVVLVGHVHESPTERREIALLPALDDVDHRLRLRERMDAHFLFAIVRAHAERNHADRREPGEAVEDAEQRVVEHGAVVDAGTHDHLAVHLDTRVEQQLEPAQARRAAAVAQQARADVGVGRVNADVQRAEPLGDHPLEIRLGEPRQRCEVPVEKRQPVVVVLQIQALAHALGQLVDEAERTVVVAGANPIEHRARQLDAERRTFGLLDVHRTLEPAPAQVELDLGTVDLDLVRDHVANRLAVDRKDLVAHQHTRPRRRRSGRDSINAGSRHGARIRGRPHYPRSVPVEKVLLAEPRGFCAGVEMAIKALAWMVRVFEPPVYCYHEIVHNRLVVDRFREQGVIFVDDVNDVPAGAPLMLSAHGSAPDVVEAARADNRYVVNAVCPLVTKVHHEAKVRARKGFTILYVGHAGHDEAVGTLAVAPESIQLVERDSDLEAAAAKVADPTRVAVLAQTTLAQNEWAGVVERTRERFPDVWTASRNDLCFATTNRQDALTDIAKRADAVVVIGSANSSNTIALTKVAIEAGCPTVLRVDGPDEIDAEKLHDARIVGVTAGASAPEELVEAVIDRLAPRDGVDVVRMTDEDEYFPPPRELRELIPALDAIAALMLGGDVTAVRAAGGPFADDRTLDASNVLAAFGD